MNFLKTLSVAAMFVAFGCSHELDISKNTYSVVAGAGWTTFDAKQGGCNDGPNGINCNNYNSKGDVYMSGGPVKNGLSDGTYYFAVLVPGYQNGGFLEGADGNLSDTYKGKTKGDRAQCGDDISERIFQVQSHAIVSYTGSHKVGTTLNGKTIIQLMPYCNTSNNGGVYILAICPVGATSPSECKYDAFRISKCKKNCESKVPNFPMLTGMKYYDANANGQYDQGEAGIGGWSINVTDVITTVVLTESDGTFAVEVVGGSYLVEEQQRPMPWMQTGNVVDQTTTSGGATVSLDKMTYLADVVDNSSVSGLYFGNVCLGAGDGHTPGFWSNQNGQALFSSDDLALMVSLNLRNDSGQHFDPATYTEFRTWLLGSNAVNMAYKLSSHLAAMRLNVYNGLVNGNHLLYAPGVKSANSTGFATVNAVMAEADASLAAYGYTPDGHAERAHQEALKNALDKANNNLNFLQPDASSCPM